MASATRWRRPRRRSPSTRPPSERRWRGADIGGYSLEGDLTILTAELERSGQALELDNRSIVDGFRIWTTRERRRLSDAYRRFVGEMPLTAEEHEALDDTRMTVQVIEALAGEASASELHAEAMSDLVDIARRFRRSDEGEIVFAFGEHRGQAATAHPRLPRLDAAQGLPP